MSVKVLNWVFQNSEATDGARLVLLALADHAQDDGDGAYPSVATIAAKTRMSERGVQYALRRLEASGHIEAAGTSQFQTVVYRIAMGGANLAGVQDAAGIASQIAPEPSLEPSFAVTPNSSLRDVVLYKEEPQAMVAGGRMRVTGAVTEVFDAWIAATDRDRDRTQLTPARRRWITQAVKSYGLDDCLTAVRHIGADAWARGQNDRHSRFDDISHALGSPERIERWRDCTPRSNGDGLSQQGRMLRDLRLAEEAS